MKNLPKPIAIILTLLTCIFAIIYNYTKTKLFLNISVICGIIDYHFIYRYIIAQVISKKLNNKVDYTLAFFREHKWEKKLYKFLKVKKWKNKLPTLNEDDFSTELKTLPEVASATCQAELDHEINVLFSLLPLIFMAIYGYYAFIIITTTLSAMGEMPFIIAQRYNRPRIVRLIDKGIVTLNGKSTKTLQDHN